MRGVLVVCCAVLAALVSTADAAVLRKDGNRLVFGPRGPPSYAGSWRAVAHSVRSSDPDNSLVYIYNFDADRKRSSVITSRFNHPGPREVRRSILDRASRQLVHISEDGCVVQSDTDGDDLQFQIEENIVDLQLLLQATLDGEPQTAQERGRPVVIYKTNINGTDCQVSWTTELDETADTNWGESQPYSFKIGSQDQFLSISILSFMQAAEDDELEIPNGVFCEGYKDPQDSRLPKLGPKSSLSFKAEIPAANVGDPAQWFEGYLSWSTRSLVYRLDFARGNDSTPLSLVVASAQKLAFVRDLDKGPEECDSVPLEVVEVPSKVDLIDPQIFDDDTLEADGVIEYFYGASADRMVFKRQDVRRNIPCTVFSVSRDDWPFQKNQSTMWEWCLHLDSSPDQNDYPVALEIYREKAVAGTYESFANYSFYHTKQGDQHLSEVRDFDISGCFDKASNQTAQLVLELSIGVKDADLQYLHSPQFLYDLRQAVVKSSGMRDEEALRVQHVNVLISKGAAYAEFTMLDELSDTFPGDELDTVVHKLNKTVNAQKFLIKHEKVVFTAVSGSLMTRENFIRIHETQQTYGRPNHRAQRSLDASSQQGGHYFEDADDASSEEEGHLFVSPLLAYGLATLLFSVGCGVAMAEWYLRRGD